MTFEHAGIRTTPPACHGATFPKAWVIDITTQAGGVHAATLLTASALNKQVIVYGKGTCDVRGDLETVAIIEVAE
jgi:hypothetical protein